MNDGAFHANRLFSSKRIAFSWQNRVPKSFKGVWFVVR